MTGEDIKLLLRGKGITQEDAAKALKMSRQNLTVLLGKAKLTPSFIENVQKTFNLTIKNEAKNINSKNILLNSVEVVENNHTFSAPHENGKTMSDKEAREQYALMDCKQKLGLAQQAINALQETVDLLRESRDIARKKVAALELDLAAKEKIHK